MKVSINDISPIQSPPPPSPSDGEPGDKSDDEFGSGPSDLNDEDSSENLDKEIEEKLGKKEEKTADDLEKDKQGKGQSSKLPSKDLDFIKTNQDIKPKFNWKTLINQFISKSKPPETTYTRPASRAATQVSIAQQIGAAAIKPGERPGEQVYKLAFVFDTSGSMNHVIRPALSEARNLLKQQQASSNSTLGICFFADKYLLLEANLIKNTAWKLDSFTNIGKSVSDSIKQSLDDIFNSASTGGTTFSSSLVAELSKIAGQGYNIIIFSDTDLLWGNNWVNFLKLYNSYKTQIFFIAPDLNNYQEIIKKLGIKPNTFGHM